MVHAESFNTVIDRKRVGLYTLRGPKGMRAQVTNYGAKIVSLIVPNDKGELADVVLGFGSLEEWMNKETYFNAVIGRYANRIKDGKFILDGVTYQLPINNGTNALHGGVHGFNEKVWDVVGQSQHSITLHYHAADGEENYPGGLDVQVTYSLTRDGAFTVAYEAKSDKPTILGFTQHAYFNLAGEGSGTVHDHTLQVFADHYTPFDETACPTGEILPVENTPMDFRQPVRIADRIDDPFFALGRGIDNNWCLPDNPDHQLQHAATVSADGRTMEVWTTMPGLQVYTGNYIEQNIGKNGKMYDIQHAVCLEAQNYPDSPNHANFPNCILRPNELYREKVSYKFV